MGRTKILAAASGIALALGGATAAGAQGFGLGADGNWYVKGFGGATWPQEELDWGPRRGGGEPGLRSRLRHRLCAGRRGRQGLHAEHRAGARIRVPAAPISKAATSTADVPASNAVMLNALYKLNGMGPNGALAALFRRRPRLGQPVDVDDRTIVGDFKRDSTLAYQVIGGRRPTTSRRTGRLQRRGALVRHGQRRGRRGRTASIHRRRSSRPSTCLSARPTASEP